MPYTVEELENVDFYKEFVENLRNNYLNELLLYAAEDDLGISKHGNENHLEMKMVCYILLKICLLDMEWKIQYLHL